MGYFLDQCKQSGDQTKPREDCLYSRVHSYIDSGSRIRQRKRCPKGAGAGVGAGDPEGGEAHPVRGEGGGGRGKEGQDPKMDKIIQKSLREELRAKEAGFL